jgi:hypothetical protein
MSAIVMAAQMLKLSKSGDGNNVNALGILDRAKSANEGASGTIFLIKGGASHWASLN